MSNVMGYGIAGTNNPLSSSAAHAGGQFPRSRVVAGKSLENHSHATIPPELTIQKPPSYILLNNGGEYKFAYGLTGSAGDVLTEVAHAHLFITGSIIDADAGPVRLDISPSAWADPADGSGGKTGDVTFVYQGGEGNTNV